MSANQVAEHLRLLSIFHYIVAAIGALVSMFPVLHLAIGIAIVSGAFDDAEKGNPPPAFFARDFMPPGSDPKSGSVRPKQPTSSPLASLGRYCSFCASLP